MSGKILNSAIRTPHRTLMALMAGVLWCLVAAPSVAGLEAYSMGIPAAGLALIDLESGEVILIGGITGVFPFALALGPDGGCRTRQQVMS